MSLTLEPIPDNEDRWVMALERLAAKIKNTDLSFHKYLVANGFRAPTIFDHTGMGFGDQVWDPPLDACPAVLLLTTPTSPVDDRGAGDERWTFSVAVNLKMWVKTSDQRKPIRALHELMRTIFAGWRTGTLDPLSTIPGVGMHMLDGDLSPVFMQASTGGTVARAAFILKFTINEKVLG